MKRRCVEVKTGTSVPDARALCPNITIVEADPLLYRQYHKEIIEAVNLIIPVHEVLSVDEMTIRPWKNESGLLASLKKGQAIQEVIRHEVGDWLSCSVGISTNAFLSKVASDLQKPRGLTAITPDDLPHKLFRMKLTDFPGIAKGMERRFNSAGITTTEQMYELSLPAMRRIFNSINGERWYQLIRGVDIQMPKIRQYQIGHSNVLKPELRNPHDAWHVACRMMEKCCERLRDEELLCRRVMAYVSSYSGDGWTRAIKITATDKTWQLLQILKLIWRDDVLKPSHVSVNLQDVISVRDMTLDLFSDPREREAEDMADKINQRFGRGTITVASSLKTKGYLDHHRIPFGKPTELR